MAVIAVLGALAIGMALSVTFTSHGDGRGRTTAAIAPTTTSHVLPTATGTPRSATTVTPPPAAAPSEHDLVEAWWVSAAKPATSVLAADIDTINGQLGSSLAVSGGCRTLGSDAAAAASTPAAPVATIQREWQLTMATVNRAANACLVRTTTQVALDLQSASRTIQDLTDQVNGHLAPH
jgi:hypothetical protein